MPTPNVIESTSGDIALIGTAADYWLPVFNGTDIYAMAKNVTIPGGVESVRIFKSTDSGVTWTAQDTANEPLFGSSARNPQKLGSKIGVIYVKSGGTGMIFRQFNMTTDLWEAESPQSTELPNFTDWRKLASGDIVACYQKQFGGPYSVHLDVYNGAAWTGPVTVASAATERIFLSMAVDAADRVYIATLEEGASLPHFEKVYIFSGGIVGAPTTMGSYNNPQIQWGPGVYIATSDEIRFPFILRGEAVSGFASPGYWSGTPSGTPSWTLVDLALTTGDPGPFSEVNITFENDNDIFICWPTRVNAITGQIQILYARQQSLGAWSAAIVLWDSLADPLSPPSLFPGDVDYLGTQFDTNSSTLGTVLALFQSFATGDFCGVLYYLANPIAGAISIACPIAPLTATVGVPYVSAAPIVTGGSGTLTFALLSGPGWMSIDTATGVVSGTPDASGSVTYTIEVTDSSSPPQSASVPAPCPLTVSPAPPIPGLPCDNPTPHPATDVQFKLIKVLATMGPVRHLPVRGSVQ